MHAGSRIPGRSDVILAAGVALLLVLQVASGNVSGPLWVAIVGAAILGACMLFRRECPWIVLATVFATIVATSLLGLSQEGLYGAIVAGFASLYSLACQENLSRALFGLGYGLGMTFWAAYRTGVWKASFAVFVLGGAVVIGQAVGAHRSLADQLRVTMNELEAQRHEAVATAVATEKIQIARELHDVIAHSVSVMVIQAGAAEEVLEIDPGLAHGPLAAVQDTGRQALGELRRLLGVLRPDAVPSTSLSPQPGLGDLDALVSSVGAAGLTVDLSISGPQRPLPAGVDLAAFRIVQEALTNVLKHSGASVAKVRVRFGRERIELDIVDDGDGGSADRDAARGQGLIGMRERVGAYGGQFNAGPRPDGGYLVAARLDIPSSR